MKRALVTGSGGFLGKAIAARLLERGVEVVGVNRGEYPDLVELGVDQRQGDLSAPATALAAAEGCDTVFHVAAKAGVWGDYNSYASANITATEHVIAACEAHGIQRLIYTSTPSVIHSGGDVEGIDESAPYPEHFHTHYPATKAIAERLVLSAATDEFLTVALRPHLIWGPGDNHLTPRIIDRAGAGKLAFVGDGSNLVDSVYIDNAADAHINAADALKPGAPCVGRPYFITNDEPLEIRDLVNRIVGAAGLEPVTKTVPPGIAFAVGALLEFIYGITGRLDEPPMTRFVAKQLSTAHWYDISGARRDLGYEPKVTVAEGIEKLAASMAE